MNPIQQSNVDFAKRGIELLAPAAAKNMPFKLMLRAGDDGALWYILERYVEKHHSMTAKVLMVQLWKRVKNGTGMDLLLSADGVKEVYHILTSYVVEHELPESVVQSLKEVS